MDTGLTIKPAGAAAQIGVVRAESAPVRDSVASDLPAAKSVTAAAETVTVRNDTPRPAANTYSRQVLLDPQSREVLFRVVDVRTRQVVRQVPDEALLRMRAYTRAMASGSTLPEALAKADIVA